MTYDVYGHLFPSLEDDHQRFVAGELALLGAGGHMRRKTLMKSRV